jgi:hypothetical protein
MKRSTGSSHKGTAILLLFLFLTAGTSVLAQTTLFTIKLKFDVEKGGLDNSLITITKNGAPYRTIDPTKGKYFIELELGAEYLMTFTKPEHISKSILVDTHVPKGREDSEFAKFVADVELKLQPPDQVVTYSQPVGRIKYDNAGGDFDFDHDYTSTAAEQVKKDVANAKPKPPPVVPVKTETTPPKPAATTPVSNPEVVAVKPPEIKSVPETPKPKVSEPEVVRPPVERTKEERVIQKDRLKITIVTVTVNGVKFEYKREEYAWGGVYCYRDGNNISERTFEKETE